MSAIDNFNDVGKFIAVRNNRSFIRTAQFFAQSSGQPNPYAALPANGTVQNIMTLEDDFDLLRFQFGNDLTSGTSTITAFAYAVSASVNDGINPVTATGAPAPWTLGTFNNAGADLRPDQNVSGSTTGFAIPACTNQAVPTRALSDWGRVPSQPRTDGGTGRLLFTRQYTGAGVVSRAPFIGASGISAWASVNNGRTYQSSVLFNVDGATVPSSYVAPTPYGFIAPLAVQYYGRSRGSTVAAFGDSITMGLHSTSDYAGWPWLSATALSTSTTPIQLVNQGIASQLHANTYLNAVAMIPSLRADVVAISCWSPNDTQTQAVADASWAHAMEIAELARVYGAVPIICTPIPSTVVSSAGQEALRLGNVARALACRANGVIVSDFNKVMTDGAIVGRMLPGLGFDGVHPNDAGYAVMAAEFMKHLNRAIGPTDI